MHWIEPSRLIWHTRTVFGRFHFIAALFLIGVAAIGLLTMPFLARSQPAPPNVAPRSVPGELLVKFQGGPRGAAAAQAQQRFKHVVSRNFDHIGWQHIQLPPGMTEAQALDQYRRHPGVIAVEPNYVLQLRLTDPNFVPNDPRFNEQWALAKIGATNAWALSTGSSNVVVAVLDTGVRYSHEDLGANMWRNPGEIPGNGIDDDGNGYVDDVYGIDAVNHDSDPNDQPIGITYHGTACASIVGAVANNGLGISGVNWSVKLMPLRLAAASNYIASAWVVECFDYVVMMKNRGVNIRVTSNSYGVDDAPSQAMRDAIDAAGNAGILSVFAAGNNSRNVDVTCDYPACFHLPSMINVAASDAADNLASFSNYGATNVDLAAPGVNVIVADGITPSSYNPSFSGTSASCPIVAGAAALLASAYPFATVAQIKTALLDSVDVLPAFSGKMLSKGRLNVGRAMYHPILSSNAPPFILASPQNQTVGLGYPVTLCVTATGAQPMNYYWQFGGAEVAHTAEPILTLSSVRLQDAGDYSVVLSNAFNMAASGVGRLTVVTNPTILAEPQGMRVLDGTNLTLTVRAAGAFPLTYQWQRNGQDIAGATNSSLPFINTDWTMSGNYRVVLSNSYNVLPSDIATLAVLTRPYIVAQPQSQTVAVGANVALSISVTNTATVPIGIRWFRNGAPRGVTLLGNQFTGTTNFPNIQTNLAGTWSAFVTNEGISGITLIMSSNAYLTVVVPPTNQTVIAGSSATLSAVAVGTGPIRYQWQHAGTNLPNTTNPTLALNNVQPSDSGDYAVVVSNAIGQPATFSANLQVFVPQPLLAQPRMRPDGTFEMLVQRLVNTRYAVETSTNLHSWEVLTTFTASNPEMPFVDPRAAQGLQRFYQVRSAP